MKHLCRTIDACGAQALEKAGRVQCVLDHMPYGPSVETWHEE